MPATQSEARGLWAGEKLDNSEGSFEETLYT